MLLYFEDERDLLCEQTMSSSSYSALCGFNLEEFDPEQLVEEYQAVKHFQNPNCYQSNLKLKVKDQLVHLKEDTF